MNSFNVVMREPPEVWRKPWTDAYQKHIAIRIAACKRLNKQVQSLSLNVKAISDEQDGLCIERDTEHLSRYPGISRTEHVGVQSIRNDRAWKPG